MRSLNFLNRAGCGRTGGDRVNLVSTGLHWLAAKEMETVFDILWREPRRFWSLAWQGRRIRWFSSLIVKSYKIPVAKLVIVPKLNKCSKKVEIFR